MIGREEISKDELCRLCPRRCGVKRKKSLSDSEGVPGICGMPEQPVLARAALHYWEEPCLSGKNGSGAVFFSGCSLHCVYCQNYQISTGNFGEEVSVERLRAIYRELAAQGAHNIDLVNPAHFAQAVEESLTPLPSLPVVWNSSGYELTDTLRRLEGKISVYLPDLKYSDADCAGELSGAADYFPVAREAIREMFRQTGPCRFDRDGMILSGVIIRHLVLPERLDNTFGVIDWVADNFPSGSVLFSLMGQYIPAGRADGHRGMDRCLSEDEYQRAVDHLLDSGIEDGYIQELSSADAGYIPLFDLTGVY